MPSNKCVVCRLVNATKEFRKHPNFDTDFTMRRLRRLIEQKDPQAIRTICLDHRNPSKLNITLSNLFKEDYEHPMPKVN